MIITKGNYIILVYLLLVGVILNNDHNLYGQETAEVKIQYDDGNLIIPYANTFPLQQIGVWFSPINRDSNGLLHSVQYFFEPVDSVIQGLTVKGFVNSVEPYLSPGAELNSNGSRIAEFNIPLSDLGSEEPNMVTVNLADNGLIVNVPADSDLFIGWETDSAFGKTFPVGLMDSSSNDYNPPRSYHATANGLIPIINDIGIRGIFEYPVTEQPDSGLVTLELRWATKETDLDLQLIVPIDSVTNDSVYWKNKTSTSGGRLDVDDTNGYGPEKISHPLGSTSGEPSRIDVLFNGPTDGKTTRAWIIIWKNGVEEAKVGPCDLNPGNFWQAGSINLYNGRIQQDSTCSNISTIAVKRIKNQ